MQLPHDFAIHSIEIISPLLSPPFSSFLFWDIPFEGTRIKYFILGHYRAEIWNTPPQLMMSRSLLRCFLKPRTIRAGLMSNQIDVISRIDFPSHWPPHGINRRLAKHLDPVPYHRLVSPVGSTFSVKEKLHVGEGMWSQVYRGNMRDGAAVLDNVVLKVFDESKFPEDAKYEDEVAVSKLPTGEPSFRYTGEIMATAC